MYNALIDVVQVKQLHAEISTVLGKRVDLLLGDRIGNVETVFRRDVVIHCRERQIRTAHFAAGHAKTFERLRGSHFVNQMKIDVNNAWFARFRMNDMVIPNFFSIIVFAIGSTSI